MEGIKGIWSLHQHTSAGSDCGSSPFDKYLVQSYTWETRVLWIDEDDEMGECEIPGFSTDSTTLFCGNMAWTGAGGAKSKGVVEDTFFVQVTPRAARLVSATSGELLHEVVLDKKVMVAEGNDSQVCRVDA